MSKRYIIGDSYAPSRRIWIECPSYARISNSFDFIKKVLDALSMWGGQDKSGYNYVSWEFHPQHEASIVKLVEAYGWTLEDFDLKD